MPILNKPRKTVPGVPICKEDLVRIAELEIALRNARQEIAALQGLLDGKIPGPASWLMSKVARQRTALDRLNRRVVAQRLVLNLLNDFGRGLTQREWEVAREAWASKGSVDEILRRREMLPDTPPAG